MFPEKNGPVDSASYAVAMAMRPIYVSICFFWIWKHGSASNFDHSCRPTSEVQIQIQKGVIDHRARPRQDRKNTFDPLFLICSRLMGFASVLKVFVGVLNAKLVVDSCLNSGSAASFQVFSVVTSLGNKPAKIKHNGNIYKRIVKANTGVQSFFAGLRHSGPQNHKFDKLVCVDASSSKNI